MSTPPSGDEPGAADRVPPPPVVAHSLPAQAAWRRPLSQPVVATVSAVAVVGLGVAGLLGYRWLTGGSAQVMTGTVVDAAGRPQDSVPVTVYVVDVHELESPDASGDDDQVRETDAMGEAGQRFRLGGATTGSDGRFAISGGVPRYAPLGEHAGPVDLVVLVGDAGLIFELEARRPGSGRPTWTWPADPALVAIEDERLDPDLAGRPLRDLRLVMSDR